MNQLFQQIDLKTAQESALTAIIEVLNEQKRQNTARRVVALAAFTEGKDSYTKRNEELTKTILEVQEEIDSR